MRKTILLVNFLAVCALSLTANFGFSPIDTHAQSSAAAEQQLDGMVGPLAAPGGDVRGGRGTYFAVVNGATELVRGTDVVSAIRTGAGHYRVTFNADVSKCAYTASIMTDAFGGAPNGLTSVGNGTNPQQVVVSTFSSDGFQTDRAFHLIVNCS